MSATDGAVRKPRYVVTTVSSDAHIWNLIYLQLLLEERGGEVINVGACAPDALIVSECQSFKPDLLVVSTVNGHGHIDGLRLVKAIRADPQLSQMKIVIGGKLGINNNSTQFSRELIEAGFDAVFDSSDISRFEQFLSNLEMRLCPIFAGVIAA